MARPVRYSEGAVMWLTIGGVATIVALGMVAIVFLRGPDAALVRKADALDRFCQGTRVAHDTVLASLEDTSILRQERGQVVARLMSDDVVHFGYTSVRTCLHGKTPPVPDELTRCQLDKDYTCIARQVRLYRDALVRAGW